MDGSRPESGISPWPLAAGFLMILLANACWAIVQSIGGLGGAVLLWVGLGSFLGGWFVLGFSLQSRGGPFRRAAIAAASYLVVGFVVGVSIQVFAWGTRVDDLLSEPGALAVVVLIWPLEAVGAIGAYGLGPN